MTLLNKIKQRSDHQQGFTLIEVLLVVAIIAILAGIVILAINPNKQLGETRNSQRKADVNTILNAVYQYSIDNQGNLPDGIPTGTAKNICVTRTASATCTTDNLVDLSPLTDSGKYLVAIPKDPKSSTGDNTDYSISQDTNGRITVAAPDAEQGQTISATR
jgi:prepilin-type N-terminal cleavage/methylation domain-containing protein